MFRLMKTIFLVERKNLKFRSIILILILFIIGSFVYLENSQFRELEPGTAAEVVALNSALDQFRNVDATDSDVASPLYRNLISQSSHLANRTLGLLMDDQDTYIKGAIELTKVRDEVYTMDGFEDVAQFIPTYRQNQLDHALFTEIHNQEERLLVHNFNFPTYIILFLFALGYGWYLLVGIFSSDILLDETNHKSLVNGYPLSIASKLFAKLLSYFLFVFICLVLTFTIAITSAAVFYNFDLNYPVALFNGNYLAIPVWQYIGISFLYLSCLSLMAIAISILLNYCFKNLYMIIFVHFFVFFIVYLLPVLGEWMSFLPFNYFNFQTVADGSVSEMTGNTAITLTNGFLTILLSLLIIFLFIYWQFHRSQTKYSRLKDDKGGIS
ncbi:hypothetical protein [Oceanobacillus sojae]|uniref:hypothetical protein n=1 Tax=Oceanobacillus sojae TaxID=582851 RepID=UPI00098850A6|nr:hypothetical protein [Oceanobacillus sojae]